MRFSLGPWMLQQQPSQQQRQQQRDAIPTHQVPEEGTALLSNSPPRSSFVYSIKMLPYNTYRTIKSIWNPPLTGAVLAVMIGLIPPVKHEFYHEEGFFYGTITTSLTNIGELFTALMLFVLGANLQLKATGEASTPLLPLLYIYVMRFAVMPIIGILVVWRISTWGWLNDDAHDDLGGDPILKFIMTLVAAGPPYIL